MHMEKGAQEGARMVTGEQFVSDGKPNPGSDAAQEAGCICPVLDNNHGKWAPYPPDGWWLRPECPLHGLAESAVTAKTTQPEPPKLVVVPRRWKKPNEPGRRRQLGYGWTLHQADCGYVRRATQAQPAPDPAFPHTEPCIYCKPTGDTGRKIQRSPNGPQSAAAKQAKQQQPDKRRYRYREILGDDGELDEVEAECQQCEITARGPSRMAARVAVYRIHQARRSHHD